MFLPCNDTTVQRILRLSLFLFLSKKGNKKKEPVAIRRYKLVPLVSLHWASWVSVLFIISVVKLAAAAGTEKETKCVATLSLHSEPPYHWRREHWCTVKPPSLFNPFSGLGKLRVRRRESHCAFGLAGPLQLCSSRVTNAAVEQMGQ